MELPPDLKHLYKGWLMEEYTALMNVGSKSAYTYRRGIESLSQTPLNIRRPEDMRHLKYIGDGVVQKMKRKLQTYCESNGYEYLKDETLPAQLSESRNESTEPPKKKRVTKKRVYIPQKGSAAYSLLKALYNHDVNRDGFTKDQLIQYAVDYTNVAFDAVGSNVYTGWSSMKTLLDKELIEVSGRPAYYSLTDEGLSLAKTLESVDDEENELTQSGLLLNRPAQRPGAINGNSTQRKQHPPESVFTYNSVNYTIWKPGEYDIVLIVDNREVRSTDQRDFFSTRLTRYGVNNEVRPLAIGDGIWIARHKETNDEAMLDFMFERKRLDDFASSIIDGRYKEQKSRLKAAQVENVFYVIEEQTASDVSRFGEAMQTGLSLNIAAGDMHVQRTKDSEDTVLFMKRMTKSIGKYYSKKSLIVIEPRNIKLQKDYSNILNGFKENFKNMKATHDCVGCLTTLQGVLSKSGMSTVQELFIKMLMTIKGVSLEKAIVIQEAYKTPLQLLDKYASITDVDARKVMLFNQFKDEIGTRKIGKALSEKICEVWGQ